MLATPMLEVADLDVAEDLRALGRHEAFPDACRPAYAFDEVSAVALNDLRAQIKRLAGPLAMASPTRPLASR